MGVLYAVIVFVLFLIVDLQILKSIELNWTKVNIFFRPLWMLFMIGISLLIFGIEMIFVGIAYLI